jgi:hypothetical protein
MDVLLIATAVMLATSFAIYFYVKRRQDRGLS